MSEVSGKNVDAALREYGLLARGGFNFLPEEERPLGPSGIAAGSVILVGHVGATYWPYFKKWLRCQKKILEHPLDSWTSEVVGAIALSFGARAVYPNDRPWQPFQQWAVRAEGLKASPLGLLIHPEFGLWHAWRAALLFEHRMEFPPKPPLLHPCDVCEQKPCLSACPVDAFKADNFNHRACADHVSRPEGRACREGGCLARNACPVGLDHVQPPAVQIFHLQAFVAANRTH